MQRVSFFILLFGVLFASACGVQQQPVKKEKDSASTGGDTGITRQTPGDSTVTTAPSATGQEAAEDTSFANMQHAFATAVKSGSRAAVKKWVLFPLLGAGGCYLEHETVLEPLEDVTGISEYQFDSLYKAIFDPAASLALSGEKNKQSDPVMVYGFDEQGAVNEKLKQLRDPGTNVYAVHVEYVRGNREGGKYFLFASIQHQYKLVALLCDGVLVH